MFIKKKLEVTYIKVKTCIMKTYLKDKPLLPHSDNRICLFSTSVQDFVYF